LRYRHHSDVIIIRMAVPSISTERQELINEINEALYYLVWRYRQQAAQQLAPLGINLQGTLVLGLIEREQLHPRALSEALDLAPPAVSHLLTDLEERGLITRSLDPDDRRRVRLELTADGRALLASATSAWNELNAAKIADLTDEESVALRDVLRKILETA